MKILFISEGYYPKVSGVPEVVRYLAEGLQIHGHEVHIATKWFKGYKAEEVINGVIIHRFDIWADRFFRAHGNLAEYLDFFHTYFFDVVVFECTEMVLTNYLLKNMDLVHGKKILHSHDFAGLSLKLLKFPETFYGMVGNTYRYVMMRYYYYITLRKRLNDFEKIILLSEVGYDVPYLKKYYAGKTVILSNAAQDIFFSKDVDENAIYKYIRLKNDEYYISVANYQSIKNQRGILREYYLSEDKEVSMVFIGSEKNKYYASLIKDKFLYDRKYGYREVIFLTGVARVDIPGIVRKAKIYLIGSKKEAFSISLIEAMAVQTPFISVNVGNAKMLPGGITMSKPSIKGMHFIINKLNEDDKLRDSLAKKGKEYADKFCRVNDAVIKLEHILRDDE